MSLFKFTEDWTGENRVVSKVVWEEDAHHLATEAEWLDLFCGVSPYYLSDSRVNPEDIVWNRVEVMNAMIDYKINKFKGDNYND